MPLIYDASRIYHPGEINFMRSCFTNAAILLEETTRNYCPSELASCIMMLYESGMRNQLYVSEMAARLAHQRYEKHRLDGPYTAANSNILPIGSPPPPLPHNPFK